MPAAPRTTHTVRHATANRIARIAPPPSPSIEAQCRAVVVRLEEITFPDDPAADDAQGAAVDVRALACPPDPTGWGGRAIVPWGHPSAEGALSDNVEPVRAGRSGWYLQFEGALYDTVRDVFVGARLNKPVSAPWTTGDRAHGCGCLTQATPRRVAIEGTIDVEAQLELMRATLRHVALAAPEVDLGILATDLFADQRVLAEHYLWQLETDGFVAHAHEERQTSLMLTAEGCSVLQMLELTKPGQNDDVMSPRMLAEAAELDEDELRPAHRSQHDGSQTDIPRFLTRYGSDELSESDRAAIARVQRLGSNASGRA